MKIADMFNEIYYRVKTNGEYVKPENTIGGMWTVDTYVYKNVKAFMMDEGYTNIITTDKIDCIKGYDNKIKFYKGNKKDLTELYNILFNP